MSPQGGGAAGARRGRETAGRPGVTSVRLSLSTAILAALVSACGQTAPSPTSTPTPRQSQTPGPEEAAVLAAYRAEQAAFISAIQTADASAPGLAATMVDPLLTDIRKQLIADRGNGIVGKGDVDLHPHVAWVSGAEAEVVDCAFDRSQLVYVSSGQPVPPVKPPHAVSITAHLVHSAAGWKVSTQSISEAPCSSTS